MLNDMMYSPGRKGIFNHNYKRRRMKGKLILVLIAFVGLGIFGMKGCQENYSKGSRAGYVTKFSEKGTFAKTFEGELSMSQTGQMGSGQVWEFSVDKRSSMQDEIANTLQMAFDSGYIVNLKYHQCSALMNGCSYRGETDYFIDEVVIKDPRYKKPEPKQSFADSLRTSGYIIKVDSNGKALPN
jgi:hypothetical protein